MPDTKLSVADKAEELARQIAETLIGEGTLIYHSGDREPGGEVTKEYLAGKLAAILRPHLGERWIPVGERLPKGEELPVLVWRGTTHRIEVGRPMPPLGKGTQDKWRPLPAPPEEEMTR